MWNCQEAVLSHTCQVSRIGRVTHAFRPNLTLTRIKLKISRIPQIIIKSHALSNKIGRVHQSALHVLCGIILVFSQGSLDCPDTLRTRTRSRQRPWARLRRECNWQSWWIVLCTRVELVRGAPWLKTIHVIRCTTGDSRHVQTASERGFQSYG